MTKLKERFEAYKKLESHPVEKKLYQKLTAFERSYIELFIFQNRDLSENEWASKVNRLFLDNKDKPKNHVQIWAILTNIK